MDRRWGLQDGVGGIPADCTLIVPGIPGNQGSLDEYGPAWWEIRCDKAEVNPPRYRSRVIMMPICEGIVYGLIINTFHKYQHA